METASPIRAITAVALLVAALIWPASPATAQGGGGSITFLADDELWVMDPADPAAAQPIAPDLKVASQAQDDQGRIVAALGDATVVRLARDGSVLAGPFAPAAAAQELGGLDVTPDGEVFTFTAVSFCSDGSSLLCSYVDFHRSDGGDSSAVRHVIDDARNASFYSDGGVVYDYLSAAYIHQLGSGANQRWFENCEDFPCETVWHPEISPDLQWLASADDVLDDETFRFGGVLRIHRLDGLPPAPPTMECEIPSPSGPRSVVSSISWSPDGTALVFQEHLSTDDPFVTEPVGIWMAEGIGTSSCEEVQASLQLIAEGDVRNPDWGPAPVAGGPTPDPDPDPEVPTQEPGAPLADGERVAGGGDEDPVAQAIATAQRLFPDGTADRVLLATTATFADALAGAPLAGGDAPVLVTPGQEALDPRVAAEIARVTGGQGQVLVLGGVNAVSEATAQQARAAAGDQPCAAPLPTSCRFAGSGREDTARLIAQTVIAEHPGSTVLVARGDEFADAITGGAYAAASGTPILLTPRTQVNQATREFIEQQGIGQVIVLGGTAAVDDATYAALPGADKRRIAGAERTETSALIASELWQPSGLEQGGSILVDVRGEDSWQTALAAAVASARFGAPQLGVEPAAPTLSAPVVAQADRLGAPTAAFGEADQVSDAHLVQGVGAPG